MNRRDLIVLAAIVLIGAAISWLLGNARPLARPAANSALAVEIRADTRFPLARQGRADLTMVVFTDYQCPACRAADPAMARAIIRDGNVRVIYRDWPIFGERSERAARVALAAARQGIYVSVHRAMMRSRGFADEDLRAAVESAGGDWHQVERDLAAHGAEIANLLAQSRLDAFGLGLRGTPGYLIGPLLVEGAMRESEFLRVFGDARKASGAMRQAQMRSSIE